ncbi:MAG: hypothetical protein JRI49_06945 [Deltaproteobacteria bacterium]|nr:hypothetical protein [Deltaproteobacteria bacterium]
MTRIDSSPCNFPELTKEECEILISILHHIEYNMEPFLKTSCLLSSCAFTFDTDYGTDEVFRGLNRKIQKIAFCKNPDIPLAKQGVNK